MSKLPPPPQRWRGWLAFIAAATTAIGDSVFTFLGLGFISLRVFPQDVRDVVVLIAAMLTAFGSGVGTMSSVIEAYIRSDSEGQLTKSERAWVGISIATSIANFALVWASLLIRDATRSNHFAWAIGMVVVGILLAVDGYGNMRTAGMYLKGMKSDIIRTARAEGEYLRVIADQEREKMRLKKELRDTAALTEQEPDFVHTQFGPIERSKLENMDKKEMILFAHGANPKASRASIAEFAGSTPQYVSQVLGG